MRVLITGASGFIGKAMSRHLADGGVAVVAAARDCGSVRTWNWLEGCVPFRLEGTDVPAERLAVDAVIHMAHDFRPASRSLNIAGTLRLVQAACRAGVSRQIFVSSYSAHERAVSEYGRSKLELERVCSAEGCMIVRPGLVIGAGGLFARMASVAMRFPVLPVPSAYRRGLPVVSIRDLCISLAALLSDGGGGPYNLFYPELVSLHTLFAAVARAVGRRRWVVPIPAGPTVLTLRIAEAMGIGLPVTSDNLLGFIANQPGVYKSNLEALLEDPQSFDTAVAEAVSALKGAR